MVIMVDVKKIRGVVKMQCPCNGIVNQLKGEITRRLRRLKIFDVDSVEVVCLKIKKENKDKYNATFDPEPSSLEGKKGIYIVVGNPHKLGYDDRSNIFYIGGQKAHGRQTLKGRIDQFKTAMETGAGSHSGGKDIHKCLKKKEIEEICLYIIGLPLKDDYECKVKEVEGCFHEAYTDCFCSKPYFVDSIPKANFNTFPSISNGKAKYTIQKILKIIISTFKDCIKNC